MPRGCPGPRGDQPNIWYCDGTECDCGGLHTTCKKHKEQLGYTFAYTERANRPSIVAAAEQAQLSKQAKRHK